MATERKVFKQYDPDRAFFRAYLIGCGVVLLAFLIGWLVIALVWMR